MIRAQRLARAAITGFSCAHLRLLPRRRPAFVPAVVDVSTLLSRASPPPGGRGYTTDDGREGLLPHAAASAAESPASDPPLDAPEEDLTLQVFRELDGVSTEERHRRACTADFLRAVLTTPREQEWRDMIAAALREGTWREHHFEALLRGVRLLRYDEAGSTPTRRLRRTHGVLIFWREEAAAEAERPSNRVVGALLTQLLRAAKQHRAPLPFSSASPSQPPRQRQGAAAASNSPEELPSSEAEASGITFREVWRFLAWMELHGYHVHSFELLDELERYVDDDDDHHVRGDRGGAARYAPEPRSRNRMEYLRGERARLREIEAGVDPREYRHPPRRVDIPRTETE
ncbi:unnamed protein product [Phytomonas sp. EM1]|nr:unnamed protein product [Phytomonas sp. EM1]|eukprot:CCW65606.1 unnamed protein product [Phytomonas sp. isolate EM1]